MQSNDIEIRSPDVRSMSSSRPDGCEVTSVASRSRSSVVLPMALDHHDLVTLVRRPHDVLGHGADAIGVGDGRAAELLDDEAHGELTVPTGRGRRCRSGH